MAASVFWAFGLLCGPVSAQDQNWDNRFGLVNFSAPISALALDVNGELYAGGQFSANPGLNHIATWDGRHWSGLGSGSANGTTNAVNAILVLGTNVFVGGNFAGISNQYVGFVASWNGLQWNSLGSGASAGVSSNVDALASDGTNLYVGGSFSAAGGGVATNIAMWDGTNWQALGAGLGNAGAQVSSIAIAPDGSVYAGGSFTNSGATAINHVATWNGANWQALGAGLGSSAALVSSIAIAPDGTIYAGGSFTNSGGTAINGIAQWDGSAWQQIGGGVTGGSVLALASDGTNLCAGGSFTHAGGVTAANIAQWNGTNWTALQTGVNGTVDAIVLTNGTVYASGTFTSAGAVVASHVAQWDGQQWSALSYALDGGNPTMVRVVAAAGTNVYAGGSFSSAGGVPAQNVACWNGSRWTALGAGTTNGVNPGPGAIAVSPAGQVYLGGIFTQAGGVSAYGIARWDGTNWYPLGGGLDALKEGLNAVVYALAFATNGDLYAGGQFTSIGGVAVNNIARWDGTNWYDVGGGLSSDGGGATVKALLIQETNVYAGGDFFTAGSSLTAVSGIAVWNGLAWAPVGPSELPESADVAALAAEGTNLYASGDFSEIGGVNAGNLAQWDGTNWIGFGPMLPTSVHFLALAVFENEVIVGGNFSTLDGQSFAGLARWIDNQWWPLGSGLSGTFPEIYSLAAGPAGLFVGGFFTEAGTQGANNFALWNLSNELPAIQITAPTNLEAFNGYQTITISAIAASANGPITGVQFFADGISLGTITNAPYSVGWSNLTSGSQVLSATATDVTGASWSAAVSITVNLPLTGPIITQEPQRETLSNGATVVLTVQATGVGTISYQWFEDGTAVIGATSSSFSLTNAQLGNSAVYTVQVSDANGANVSTPTPVSILQPVTNIWTVPVIGGLMSSPAIGQGGIVYIGSDDYNLYAFAPNAAFQWRYQTANYVRTSPAVDTNNFIYFGSDDDNVYCLNPDGTKRWSFTTGGEIGACSAIGSDGTIYVGSLDNNLYALNPDGSQKWSFATHGGVGCAPAIATNGTIYFASGDSNVYALTATGGNLWTFAADAPFYGNNSPIIDADGTIYIAPAGTNLYALNPDGTLKWKFGAAGPFYCSPVIGPDGTIYIGNDGAGNAGNGTQRGPLYALAPDGTEKWQFLTSNTVRTSAAVSADGTIYFGSDDQNFYALNPDGTARWELPAGTIESSPAIRFDGVVYFGAGEQTSVSALLGTSPLASSPWPMFQHDVLHTGNAATPPVTSGWQFPSNSNEFDDQVNAVATSGNDIYVGGNFHVAGGVAANYIAHWNGSSWLPLGVGVNGPVNAIAVTAAGVYAGGEFTMAGGTNANYIAFWDGSRWYALGGGMSDIVNALAANSHYLFVGGDFLSADGTAANHVAQWDGSSWSALAAGVSGPVQCLAVSSNDLYAAGSNIGAVEHWDGSQWSSLGTVDDSVSAIASAAGAVYVGGAFSQVNGIGAQGIAEWVGGQWSPVGGGVGDPVLPYVNSITLDGTNVYAGGTFTTAGGIGANRIAMWDGTQWHALGTGVTGATLTSACIVNSIGLANGQVYAGGAFLAAGGDATIKNFAAWNGTNWLSIGPAIGFVEGQFSLFLTDQLGRTYGVQASSDLLHWTRVTTFTNLGGYSEFIDSASSNMSRRYYRLVVP
jgi:trimeric autotransporter adhesin